MHSYFLALVLIGLVVVLLASWFGMYLARGITVPIKLLAEGTQAIADGDLDYEIPSVGDDEIGQLVEFVQPDDGRPARLRRPSSNAAAPIPRRCCATYRRAWSGWTRRASSPRSIRARSGCSGLRRGEVLGRN